MKKDNYDGTSYNSFLDYATSIGISENVVDVKATFDRYKDPKSKLLTPDSFLQLKGRTDVFLAHDWGLDELERQNHNRVAAVNKALKSLGFGTWFDSEKMTGDVVDQMVRGIDNSSVVIVFVTQRYMNKVNGLDANDNCRKEFKYACHTKSSTKMIPVVMEPRMTDIRSRWSGVVKMELGNILYVDFSHDNDFQSVIQQLKAEILSRTNPLWVLKSGGADELMVQGLSSWFVTLKISSMTSRRYAEILVENNTGSIEKLQRKLEKNPSYLEEIDGFDEDDIVDIKAVLKDVISASTTTEYNDNAELTTNNKGSGRPGFLSPFLTVSVFLVFLALLFSRFVKIWNYSHGREIEVSSQSHSGSVSSLSWNPVGNKIASGSFDNTIKIWDGKSLELLKTLEGHSGWVHSVSWNHNGSQIASGSHDNTIIIWDSFTGKALHTLRGHANHVASVAWNHDSSKIVSGSSDKTIKIWGWANSASDDGMIWKLLRTLEGHS
jgi:hypothetical protein